MQAENQAPAATKAPPTPKKKADPLVKVAKAEAALAQAQEVAQVAGRKVTSTTQRVKQLLEQRARLVRAEPELIDHRGAATDPANPVGRVDAELTKIDLEDLQLRASHALQLVRAAEERWQDLVRVHGEAIDEARRPEGEALVEEWKAQATALAEVTENLIGYGQRSMTLAATRSIDTRRVPIDAVGDLARTIRDLVANPPPVPWIETPPAAPKIEEEE